jgi:predicted transposase YdaD
MTQTEWNWDIAREIWQEEAREEGLSQGRDIEREVIAHNALKEGLSTEMIQKITGLNINVIEEIKD